MTATLFGSGSNPDAMIIDAAVVRKLSWPFTTILTFPICVFSVGKFMTMKILLEYLGGRGMCISPDLAI